MTNDALLLPSPEVQKDMLLSRSAADQVVFPREEVSEEQPAVTIADRAAIACGRFAPTPTTTAVPHFDVNVIVLPQVVLVLKPPLPNQTQREEQLE